MLTKICSACKADLPLDAFSPHPNGRYGRQPRCKPCRSTEASARYARSESRQLLLALKADRTCGFSGCSVSLANRQRSAMHCSITCAREDRREQDRKTREPVPCEWCGHPIPASKRRSARFCTATCNGNAQSNKRRARRRGAAHERYSRQDVWHRDRGECRICGMPADRERWHLDHIIPISCGVCRGPDTFANVAVTHPACNLSKGATCPHCSATPA